MTLASNTAITAAQEFLQDNDIDGWLLRDYFDVNPIIWNLLGDHAPNVTRPCWLWVPAWGDPIVLAHEVDAGRFGELWGTLGRDIAAITGFSSREQQISHLKMLLGKATQIAMEYSPDGQLPRVGRVDAGTVELIRTLGVEVISSGDVLQHATERWSEEQVESHRYAAARLTRIVRDAFEFVRENINWKITEHDLAEFIRGRYDRLGLTTTDGPVVAVDAHSSDPHYEPHPDGSAVIRRGSWLLIDLWARRKSFDDSIYADITWTGFLGSSPSDEQRRVFQAVIDGRDAAVDLITDSYRSGTAVQGWQADRVARDLIAERGYGDHFVHRLGHSLGKTVHSNAVNLDDWETRDTRLIVPGLGVTIEPGIYVGHFGVRSEIDLFITPSGPLVTTEPQTEIILIDV